MFVVYLTKIVVVPVTQKLISTDGNKSISQNYVRLAWDNNLNVVNVVLQLLIKQCLKSWEKIG